MSGGRAQGSSRADEQAIPKEDRPIAKQLKDGDRFYRGKDVRVIAPDNEQLGILTFREALARAEAYGLDLVEVAGKANPPVCRIMDYGKHQYEESKRLRDARKKQHQHKVKEIKYHPNIDVHDYQTKINRAVAFLEKGDKLKVSMFFRGREMAHQDLGMDLMKRVIDDLGDLVTVDSSPRKAGRMLAMMLSPKAHK
jgi:translation initiation factor IF-3